MTIPTWKNKRLSVICKLRLLFIAAHLLLSLYRSIIQHVLLFHSDLFVPHVFSPYCLCLTKNIAVISHSEKNKVITRLALTIANYTDHPLHRYFKLMPSERRYRTMKWGTVSMLVCVYWGPHVLSWCCVLCWFGLYVFFSCCEGQCRQYTVCKQ